jgi:hypothetical protein
MYMSQRTEALVPLRNTPVPATCQQHCVLGRHRSPVHGQAAALLLSEWGPSKLEAVKWRNPNGRTNDSWCRLSLASSNVLEVEERRAVVKIIVSCIFVVWFGELV